MRRWVVGLSVLYWVGTVAAAPVIETLVPNHQAVAEAELLAAEQVLDYAQSALAAHDVPQLKRALKAYRAHVQRLQLGIVRARAQGQLTSPFVEACKERLKAHRERLVAWLDGASRQEQGVVRHTLKLADHFYHQLLVELVQYEVYSRSMSMRPINEVPTYGTE